MFAPANKQPLEREINCLEGNLGRLLSKHPRHKSFRKATPAVAPEQQGGGNWSKKSNTGMITACGSIKQSRAMPEVERRQPFKNEEVVCSLRAKIL